MAAGDLNILHGHGEHGSKYWAARYETVFARMEALGLPFVGPQAPHGRQADPWLDELPSDSRNVPTYPPADAQPGDCDTPAGLRLRVARHGRFGERACAQRARRVGVPATTAAWRSRSHDAVARFVLLSSTPHMDPPAVETKPARVRVRGGTLEVE